MKGALVTGAGMRVGRALAMALAADGFFTYVHYNRSAGPARETVAAIIAAGGKARAVRADLSSARQAEALVGKCRARGVQQGSSFGTRLEALIGLENFARGCGGQ